MLKTSRVQECVERVCVGAEYVWHLVGKRRESARSGEADDGEGAEADSALRRRQDRGLLSLGLVLLLGRGLLGLLGLDLGLGLPDLDLERAELVVPSKDGMVLPNGRVSEVM